MFSIHANRFTRTFGSVIAVVAFMTGLSHALGEEKLADPIYRVANETSAVQPAATTQNPAPVAGAVAPQAGPTPGTAAAQTAFDLTQKPGEHPLQPVIRVVKASQEEIDQKIHDYSCNLFKQERIDGELGEKQQILLKVMHAPFSVYMLFLTPFAGREVVYVAGQNNGNMVVLEAGFKRMLGKMNLDPNGTLAMKGQKHPITDVGIRNLTVKLAKMWEAETKFAECEVTSNPDVKINGRSTTMIQVIHPVPRQDFKFHAARLFMDNELKVPIHFDAYLWPGQEGSDPPLEESYTYANLKLNNNYTAREFDTVNNPDIFR